MVFGMGPVELLVILLIALVIFGPKNLPKLGKSLGQTVKNVREGMEGDDEPKQVSAPAEPAAAAPQPNVTPAVDPIVEVEEDVQFCSACGTKNDANAAFCNKCGAKLG